MFKDVLLVVIFPMNVLFEFYIIIVRNGMFYTKKKSPKFDYCIFLCNGLEAIYRYI